MISFLLETMRICKFAFFQSKLSCLFVHFITEGFDVVFMSFILKFKCLKKNFFTVLWAIRIIIYFVWILVNQNRHLWLFLFIANEKKPSSKFSSKNNGGIISRRQHQRTKAVIYCQSVISLHIGTCSRHVRCFVRYSQINILWLFNAVDSQLFHDSANSVCRAHFRHARNFTLFILTFTIYDLTLIIIAYCPFFSCYNWILISHGRLNDLIELVVVE